MTRVDLFTSDQRNLVRAVLDRIIPAEGDRPGAGAIGVADYLERAIAPSPGARRLFLDGLAEIELVASRQAGAAFVGLPGVRQDEILTLVETARPVFFDQLVNRTYEGYYGNPRVLVAIGHDPRPPQPRGYTLPAFDPAVLDQVRARCPIFRVVPP